MSAAKIEVRHLAALSVWAVEARYPGDNPEAVPADATAAFQQAQAIVITTLAELAERGFIDRPGSAA